MAADTVILDLNDARLGLWRGPEQVLASPGYALLEGRNYAFGETARAQARLHPRQINHRFWSQMDTETLHPAFGPSRHSADLVHAHLMSMFEEAGRPEQWIVAASGSLQHDQLALLLGIIEQCPFTAVGLVDRAVAAVAASPAAEYNWYVELQLHQALVTGMRYEDGSLRRDRVVPIPGSGWLAVQDSLAKAIADAFIRQTRFDPRHQAATEQALYDQLPALLETLQSSPEQNLDLGGRRARVERSLLAEACENHYQRILRTAAGETGQVILGPTLASLPEIGIRLPQALKATPTAVSESISRNEAAITGAEGGLHFITSLPATAAAAATPAPEPEPIAPVQVEPIARGRCQIDIEGNSLTIRHLQGPATRVNGTVIGDSRPLEAGDLIETEDGSAWRLVEVRPDD